MMKVSAVISSLALTVAFSALAMAQFKNSEHEVEYRQGVFTAMGVHFGRLGAMVRGKQPFDVDMAKRDAELVAMLSTMPWIAFSEESDGVSPDARPEIWLEMDKFKDKASSLQVQTKALREAAQTGDLDKIKAAFSKTAQSCKACHDAYKE